MNILPLVLLVLVFAPAAAGAGGGLPVPFEDAATGLWGYRDRATKKTVIPPRFSYALDFHARGTAFAVSEEGWVCIDRQGRTLLKPFLFDNSPDEFQGGLARFVEEGRIGYFDRAGRVVIPADYDFGLPFEKGLAAVCRECIREYHGEHYTVVDGTWGCVDKRGRLVRPLAEAGPGCGE
ncbi:hypothetical protein ASZ90_000709 [hydrocarbon metagenome]|uniref:WG repeat-containing protein n=1 Tax=hydrocarbon metagenome TaxID=938273 RepID=A0A0W8G8B3_9ZZZZ